MMKHPTIPGLILMDGKLYQEIKTFQDDNGYLMARVMRNGKGRDSLERLHRLIWEMANGIDVPPGMVVRHKDDNNRNNNPCNLILGTQAENMRDAVRNGNSTKGEKNARAKLTEDQVREIRQRRNAGESLGSIARDFGISAARVCDLNKGRGWSHVD